MSSELRSQSELNVRTCGISNPNLNLLREHYLKAQSVKSVKVYW